MTVCRNSCLDFNRNQCYNCGYWVCPRTRECHYEIGVLKSINRLVKSCSKCDYGFCGVCTDNSLKSCGECKTKCFYCIEMGIDCLFCKQSICLECKEIHNC